MRVTTPPIIVSSISKLSFTFLPVSLSRFFSSSLFCASANSRAEITSPETTPLRSSSTTSNRSFISGRSTRRPFCKRTRKKFETVFDEPDLLISASSTPSFFACGMEGFPKTSCSSAFAAIKTSHSFSSALTASTWPFVATTSASAVAYRRATASLPILVQPSDRFDPRLDQFRIDLRIDLCAEFLFRHAKALVDGKTSQLQSRHLSKPRDLTVGLGRKFLCFEFSLRREPFLLDVDLFTRGLHDRILFLIYANQLCLDRRKFL